MVVMMSGIYTYFHCTIVSCPHEADSQKVRLSRVMCGCLAGQTAQAQCVNWKMHCSSEEIKRTDNRNGHSQA